MNNTNVEEAGRGNRIASMVFGIISVVCCLTLIYVLKAGVTVFIKQKIK